jgi:predicted RNA methylase
MKEFKISTPALAVLSTCSQAGQVVHINAQLERPLYAEVDKVLRAIGGKWDRKRGGHLFDEPASDVAMMLEGCIQTGLAVPLRPEGYFPTPPELGKRMVELARIQPGMTILEPSAGDGQLAKVIEQLMPPSCKLYCIEEDLKLFKILNHLHEGLCTCADFLTITNSYDRIIMNPPFERLKDVDHITHAFDCLKPAGRVVSVASNSVTFRMEKRAVLFRQMVARYGIVTPLPNNTFKPSGTLVNTVLLELQK